MWIHANHSHIYKPNKFCRRTLISSYITKPQQTTYKNEFSLDNYCDIFVRRNCRRTVASAACAVAIAMATTLQITISGDAGTSSAHLFRIVAWHFGVVPFGGHPWDAQILDARQRRRCTFERGDAAQHAIVPRSTEFLHFGLLDFPYAGHSSSGDAHLATSHFAGTVWGIDAPGTKRHHCSSFVVVPAKGQRWEIRGRRLRRQETGSFYLFLSDWSMILI